VATVHPELLLNYVSRQVWPMFHVKQALIDILVHVIIGIVVFYPIGVALARLGGLGLLAKPKPLISQESSCEGLHYGPDSGAGAAVIFGGGCSGRTSLSSASSSLRSLSGSV